MTVSTHQVTDDELKKALVERELLQEEEIEQVLANEAQNIADIEKNFRGKLFLIDPHSNQLLIKDSNSLELIDQVALATKPSDTVDLEAWGNHLALLETESNSYQGPLSKNSLEPYGLVITPSMSYAYLSELSKSNFLGLVDTYCFGYVPKNDVEHGPFDLYISSDQKLIGVTDRAAGAVHLVDTTSHAVLKTVKVRESGSKKTLNLVFDDERNRLLLTDNQSQSIKCLDLETFALTEHNPGLGILGSFVKVKGASFGFLLSLKPKPALHYIDLSTLKASKSLVIKGQFFSIFRNDPCDLLLMAPDNKHLVFMTYLNAPKPLTPVLSVVDVEQVRTVRRYSIKGGKKPSWITYAIDNPLKDVAAKTLSDLLVEARLIDRNTLQELKYQLTKEAQDSQPEESDPMKSASAEHLSFN